jgi:2,4-didehydro-3-deoxy-L-rhamnonate hydrolase
MKLVGYRQGSERMIGSLQDDGSVRELAGAAEFYRDPAFWLASKEVSAIRQASSLQMLPAVPENCRVICVGLNYKRHAAEVGLPWPETPVIFARWTSTLVSGDARVPLPEERFDWEGELAVIIGRRTRAASAQEASDAILGYAALNDMSARTWQTLSSQWTLGKCSEASAPMSAICTRDEAGDPAAGMRLTTRVNGELVQDGSTADMIFDVPKIISFLSGIITLEPGDVIATGTPSGVGVGMKPPRFLRVGDRVEVSIDSVGQVAATVVEPHREEATAMASG